MTTALHEVTEFAVGLPDGWYPMPLDVDSAEWSAGLASSLTADASVVTRLAAELRGAQETVVSMDDPLVRAAVWVDSPETGHADAVMVFSLAELSDTGSPDDYEQFLLSYRDRGDADGLFYSVSTWRSEVDAGPVVGSYNLIAHSDEQGDLLGSYLEERVVIAVFPPRAAQCVQFIFSAQGLGSFRNAPEETQGIVAGLRVTLDAAS